MQRCVAVVLVAALGTGCSTVHTGGKIGTGVGLGLIAISIAMSQGVGGPGGETDPEDVAFIPLTAGITILLPSLVLMLATSEEPDQPHQRDAPSAPTRSGEADKREQAWQMTKLAAKAARDGDCASALETGKLVANLDADFHATVFVHDAAIARCLATPSPTAPD
jgi:hypothetical protein